MFRETRLQSRTFPVAQAVAVEDAVRGLDRRLRRAGRRLAELHMDDRTSLGLQAVRQAADFDGVKRGDVRSHGCIRKESAKLDVRRASRPKGRGRDLVSKLAYALSYLRYC